MRLIIAGGAGSFQKVDKEKSVLSTLLDFFSSSQSQLQKSKLMTIVTQGQRNQAVRSVSL